MRTVHRPVLDDSAAPAIHAVSGPRARATPELPSGVVAGATLDYVVDLTNPTDKDMILRPCPGYIQGLGSAGKVVLALNCRARRTVPAHQTVRFAMQLRVPASMPTGPDTVYWQVATPVGAYANGSLHVYGRDRPCLSSQIQASIKGPGRVPGPADWLSIKGEATDVPLTITNISSRPCSVYGVPAVTISAARSSALGLRQVPNRQFIPRPVPLPETLLTLAPHAGAALTKLYWNLPWCGRDPNPPMMP